MADYNVIITDGVGSQAMKAGNYSVAVTANGYDAATLSPSSFTATAAAGSQAFTVSASGALTFIFNDTGAAGGDSVVSGSVVMTDSSGTTQYGSPVSIGADGTAVFQNVPFDTATPVTLYFVQLESDSGHNVYSGVITVDMSASAQTEYVLNPAIALQSFTLTSADYSGLPVSGELTFTA